MGILDRFTNKRKLSELETQIADLKADIATKDIEAEKRNADQITSALSNPVYWNIVSPTMPWMSESEKLVTEEQMKTISTVYAAVDCIAKQIAISPLKLYKKTSTGKKIVTDKNNIFNTRPNDRMNWFQYKYYYGTCLALRSNAFAEVVRNNNTGQLTRLSPFLPETTLVLQNPNGHLEYTVWIRATKIDFHDNEVLHCYRFPDKESFLGTPPLYFARNLFGIALAQQEFVAKAYANGSHMQGIIESPQTVTKPSIDVIKDDFEKFHRGTSNVNKVGFLHAGMHYNPINLSAVDAEMIKLRQFTQEEICQIFDVPPSRLTIHEKSNVANVTEQSIIFYEQCILPYFVSIEEEINSKCFPDGDYFVKFDESIILRTNPKDRADNIKTLVFAGIKTVNEARTELDMNPVGPEGDVLILQSAMINLSDVGKNWNIQPSLPTKEDIDNEKENIDEKNSEENSRNINLKPIYADMMERIKSKEKVDITRKLEKNDVEFTRNWLNKTDDEGNNIYFEDHKEFIKRIITPYICAKGSMDINYNKKIDEYLESRKKELESFIENNKLEIFKKDIDILGENINE